MLLYVRAAGGRPFLFAPRCVGEQTLRYIGIFGFDMIQKTVTKLIGNQMVSNLYYP